MPAIIANHARPDPSAQDEALSCALQLKLQACRPTTYVDVVTRSRYPDAAVGSVTPIHSRSASGSRAAKDHGPRDTASDSASNDAQNKPPKESSPRGGRVRKHVHFAEDEGYASATATPTPAPTPKQQPSHEVTAAKSAGLPVVGGDRDDRGRASVKSGSARVPTNHHHHHHHSSDSENPPPTVTSRKATSQHRTSKAKKRPRTDKADSPTLTPESTGGSYRNQYGNIVFEDFF